MEAKPTGLKILDIVSIVFLLIATGMVFFYAPMEAVMGNVQRVFYFHVSTAWVFTALQVYQAILASLASEHAARMIAMRNADLAARVPPEQLELAKQQLAAFWSAPLYMAFIGLIERIFAICLQISLTIMVLYSVVLRKPVWFWIALFWHAFVDALTVYLMPTIGVLGVEAVIGVCAVISLVILFRLRPRFVQEQSVEVTPS